MEQISMTQDSRQNTQSDAAGVDGLLARHGGLSYLEIPATDARRSAVFYQEVFGWKLRGEDADQAKFSDQTGHLIGKWVTGRRFRDGLVCCRLFMSIGSTML